MRLNHYLALATGLSRRKADDYIACGKVSVNGVPAKLGQRINELDKVRLDDKELAIPESRQTIVLNKPVGYVCSRNGQGSKTIYDLLPKELHELKPAGRLDKDSSGLLLLTNDGSLAYKLTHPTFNKQKVYSVTLAKSLKPEQVKQIENGVDLADGISRLSLSGNAQNWVVTISEGRNRQIRRTFEAVNNKVLQLHRLEFGNYKLDNLITGEWKFV